MVTYLLNLSVVWLLSLLFFELFLIREKYHSYNRSYLLLTLIAGSIVPLFSRPVDFIPSVQQPLSNLDATKKAIDQATKHPDGVSFSISNILLPVYYTGIVVSLLMLTWECVLLLRYYRGGIRQQLGKLILIETKKNHGPFSFGRYLFVGNKESFSEKEWEMVLQHEQAHSGYRHLIDVLLLKTFQIAFWFHPLIYWYRKRVLLIHEYQADQSSASDPYLYGSFLVEQALLQTGPVIAHSFNRSPIKNRLTMLSTKPSRLGKFKFLAMLPVLGSIFFCCTAGKSDYEKKRDAKNHTIAYKGNVFGLPLKPERDTVFVELVEGGKRTMMVAEKDPTIPISMNGKPITESNDLDTQPRLKSGDDFPTLLFRELKTAIEQLPDGDYQFNLLNIVISPSGEMVYFDMGGIYPNSETIRNASVVKTIADINRTGEQYLNETEWEFLPGIKNGEPVLCKTGGGFNLQRTISIKNHKATF